MHTNLLSLRITCAAAALALAAGGIAIAQQQPQAAAVRTAEQQYKNIQVLQGTPASELIPAMHVIENALGVDCEFCHVMDRSKDDLATKQTARKMITMMMDINKNSFAGRSEVTCFTCHRGGSDPATVSTLPTGEAMVAPAETGEKPAAALPTVDQILAKYVQALGGEQALRKITSRVITATWDVPTGPGGTTPVAAKVERYEKAPDLVVNIDRAANFTIEDGFDGKTAWTQDAKGAVSDATNIDQGHLRRAADFYESLDLKQHYARLAVRGTEKVNGKEAYVLVGVPEGDRPERLFFDTQTGLLVRRVINLPSPVGDDPFAVEYDDYRDTGSGVKVPFLIRSLPGAAYAQFGPLSHSTMRVEKVQDNLPIDEAKFVKPQSKPAGQ